MEPFGIFQFLQSLLSLTGNSAPTNTQPAPSSAASPPPQQQQNHTDFDGQAQATETFEADESNVANNAVNNAAVDFLSAHEARARRLKK